MDNFIGELLSDYKVPQIEPVGNAKFYYRQPNGKVLKL